MGRGGVGKGHGARQDAYHVRYPRRAALPAPLTGVVAPGDDSFIIGTYRTSLRSGTLTPLLTHLALLGIRENYPLAHAACTLLTPPGPSSCTLHTHTRQAGVGRRGHAYGRGHPRHAAQVDAGTPADGGGAGRRQRGRERGRQRGRERGGRGREGGGGSEARGRIVREQQRSARCLDLQDLQPQGTVGLGSLWEATCVGGGVLWPPGVSCGGLVGKLVCQRSVWGRVSTVAMCGSL